jgi:hypothetical protein
VGHCNTFVGKIKIKIQFEVVEKKLCCPDGFFLSLCRAGCVIYTNAKIWRPCPKMGQGWPWKGRGMVESRAPLPPPFPLFSPQSLGRRARGEREKKRGRKRGEEKGGGGRRAGGRGGGGKRGRVGAWVGSMHHPLPWLPPQTSSKIGSF